MKKITLVLIILFISVTISSAQTKIVTSASDPWPPFVDPDHPKMGITIEVVTAAFKTQGYILKHKIIPWSRAEQMVKRGKIDILPNTWKTDKRKSYLLYSKPYAYNKIKFIKRKGAGFEYNGLKSLKGKKVGIIRGYGYGDEFMNSKHFKRFPVNNLILNIRKLVAKRIDLTLEDEIVAKNQISKKEPKLLSKIEFTKKYISSKGLHVTCGLKNPSHRSIIMAFNKGLKKIKSNGTLKKIFKSYGL
ncbi:MAG: transporter substrate-binding domain-containing protein [Desulfobacterales bacterium]|nr:transporter substrate-binding domain-containing protein [Desulfobacterales bacterium]MCP4163462.1 transporter substrate-binding domain-containing protein [Deltaproteobacteria bacterium]